MQINFHQKNLTLSEQQEDYVSAKIETLTRFKVMEDPSVTVKVDVEYMEHASSNNKIIMAVTATVPGALLRAEADASTVGEAIDLIEEKLQHQLEKYKTAHGG